MNTWAAWAITGALAVAIPQFRQLVRWWHADEPAGALTARRLKLRRGKLLETAMNVPLLLGFIAVFLGADWRWALVVAGIPVCLLWALQIHVRNTGEPVALTPPPVRSRAGERA
ncbi:MAG TPA: hypothetical protein VH418_00555 [Solirubrobacteraceae bacterium]